MDVPAPPAPQAPKKPRRWPWIVGMVVSLFVGIGIGAGVAFTPSETMETCTGGSPVTMLPPAEGASFDNPIPVGDVACVEKWRIQVVGFTPNATDAILEVSSFGKRPQVGEQYVLVTVKMTYEADYGSADPYFYQRWAVMSSDGTIYKEKSGLINPPDGLGDSGDIPSGISAVGNVNFLVKSDDVQGLRLYVEASTPEFEGGGYIGSRPPDFDTEGAFFALEE